MHETQVDIHDGLDQILLIVRGLGQHDGCGHDLQHATTRPCSKMTSGYLPQSKLKHSEIWRIYPDSLGTSSLNRRWRFLMTLNSHLAVLLVRSAEGDRFRDRRVRQQRAVHLRPASEVKESAWLHAGFVVHSLFCWPRP